MCSLDAADCDCCIPEPLQPKHRIQPLLHTPVILLDQVVQVLACPNNYIRRQYGCSLSLANCRMCRRVSVQGDFFWCPMFANCSCEKPLRGFNISVLAQKKVNCVTLLSTAL